MKEQNHNLINILREIIIAEVHQRKCKAEMTDRQWQILDVYEIADAVLHNILPVLEAWAYIPCCHVSGCHDPMHFVDRKYICEYQKSEAYERLCASLGINPTTKSDPGCFWCKEYLHYRRGEGMHLFEDSKNLQKEKLIDASKRNQL